VISLSFGVHVEYATPFTFVILIIGGVVLLKWQEMNLTDKKI